MKHLSHYLSLIAVIIFGMIGFYFFSYDRIFRSAIIVGVAAAYVVWGIVHHHIHDDLHTSVVVEYILIASLGLIIVFSLILNA